jgi:hypothetical protein
VTLRYSLNPELDRLARNTVAETISRMDKTGWRTCPGCGRKGLSWSDEAEMLIDRTDHSPHSCPKRRAPVRAFKESTYRRKGRIK